MHVVPQIKKYMHVEKAKSPQVRKNIGIICNISQLISANKKREKKTIRTFTILTSVLMLEDLAS